MSCNCATMTSRVEIWPRIFVMFPSNSDPHFMSLDIAIYFLFPKCCLLNIEKYKLQEPVDSLCSLFGHQTLLHYCLHLPTSVSPPWLAQFLSLLHQSKSNSSPVLCSRVSLAGQHRLLLQLRKRRPSRVPVCSLQGAAQSIIRDKQWAQWEG